MRALVAIAIFACGLAGVTAAGAADLVGDDPGNNSAGYFSPYGQRTEQLVIYDNQPGVLVRDYWRAPWRNHHYFPATGIPPRIGRYENLSAIGRPPKPAKTFRRSWSNAWAFEYELSSTAVQPFGIQGDTQPNSQSGIRFRPHAHGSHRIRMR